MLHISEKRKKISPRFFANKEYAKILNHLVIACVDIVIHTEDEILLAKRNTYPRKDWWLIGGRMISGESPIKTAVRKLKEEAGLDVKTKDLKFIDVYSTAFSKRNLEPKNNGAQTLNLLYALKIKDKNNFKLKLTKSEYSDYRWVEIDQINDFFSNDIFKEMFIDIANKLKA